MNTSEFKRLQEAGMRLTMEADKAVTPVAKSAPKPVPKPAPKGLAPTKPAPKAAPTPAPAHAPAAPAPVDGDAKMDAVKKLHKMGEKVFKALDDMVVFANESGLKEVAAMVGTVEDAYWDMKRNLAKIRESTEGGFIPMTEAAHVLKNTGLTGISKMTGKD